MYGFGESRDHPKTIPKRDLEHNRRKSDRNIRKIPKSTPNVVPWGSLLEPQGDPKWSKIDAGPTLDPVWRPGWHFRSPGGLRVGARTPKGHQQFRCCYPGDIKIAVLGGFLGIFVGALGDLQVGGNGRKAFSINSIKIYYLLYPKFSHIYIYISLCGAWYYESQVL